MMTKRKEKELLGSTEWLEIPFIRPLTRKGVFRLPTYLHEMYKKGIGYEGAKVDLSFKHTYNEFMGMKSVRIYESDSGYVTIKKLL